MENQNDQVFEADQDVNALNLLRPQSGVSRRLSHKGQDALKAAFGGFDTQYDTEHDRTPLLKKTQDQERISTHDTEHEGEGRQPPTWDGERDFEGRPWWNMPSVRGGRALVMELLMK